MNARSTETIRPLPTLDLGHDRAAAYLATIRGGRALLLHGPEGVGKEYTAVDFARRLCCRRDPPCPRGLAYGGETPVDDSAAALDRAGEESGNLGLAFAGDVGPDAAGNGAAGADRPCPLCVQAARLEHPGIHLVYPTPTQGAGEGEDGDVADLAKVLESRREGFFAPSVFAKRASIRIARARAVIQRANARPFGSPRNVFVFVDAHVMREEAQHALLKLVEEPPEHCAMVFVTHNPEAVLYTIRSRCQRVRFTPLKTTVIERILVDYYGVSGGEARRAALLAQGNLRRARTLVDGGGDGERRDALAFVAGLQQAI